MDITENVETAEDLLGIPVEVGDKVAFSMPEKLEALYTGEVISINIKHYTSYNRVEFKIKSDKTKKEVTRPSKYIIGLQGVFDANAEFLI